MTTIELLKEYGANTEEGIIRCCGMEDFYLKMIRMVLVDNHFALLGEAVKNNDLDAAFESAHALKGAVGNVSLDPLYNRICDMVEPLRIRDTAQDYAAMYQDLLNEKEAVSKIVNA